MTLESTIEAATSAALLPVLGRDILYAPEGQDASTVTGIFDASYERINQGEAGVSTFGPAVFFLLADLPVDPEDDEPTITIDGYDYSIRETAKDGIGGVLIFLHRD